MHHDLAHLLVRNGKFSLRLHVLLGERLELLDRCGRKHRGGKLGVGLGVFVAGLVLPSIPLLGTTIADARTLTKTFVSPGSPANVSLRALCISAGVPSKNLPQPFVHRSARPGRVYEVRVIRHTSDEEGVTGEDSSIVSILEEIANAVLRMAGRMQCLDGDVLSDLELFSVPGGLGHGLTILPTGDGQTTEALQL